MLSTWTENVLDNFSFDLILNFLVTNVKSLTAVSCFTPPHTSITGTKRCTAQKYFSPSSSGEKTSLFCYHIYWFNNNLQPTTWSSSTWKGLFFGQIRLCGEARNKSITFKAYRKSIRFHSVHLRGSQENSKHFQKFKKKIRKIHWAISKKMHFKIFEWLVTKKGSVG